MFHQILKDVYTSNLFDTCFIVANDDLKGKTTHFTVFYTNSISQTDHFKGCCAKKLHSFKHVFLNYVYIFFAKI